MTVPALAAPVVAMKHRHLWVELEPKVREAAEVLHPQGVDA